MNNNNRLFFTHQTPHLYTAHIAALDNYSFKKTILQLNFCYIPTYLQCIYDYYNKYCI